MACLASFQLMAQEKDSTAFKVTGEPILRVFANYHMQIDHESGNSAFEVERAYIGYDADIHPRFSIKINLDIGSPDDVSDYSRIRRYAYFKNAALTYKANWFSTSFGLIDMLHFKLQEDFWGHRYIERSFADRFRFGPSADLGWNLVLYPLKSISFDLCFSNGEGYNNLQRDNTLKLGVGTIVKPLKGLSIRLYGDIMEKSVVEATFAGFIGYRYKELFKIGADYNHKFNESYQEGYQRYGYSVYGSYYFLDNFEVFARYDWIVSNIPENEDFPWNLEDDGSSILAGLQYQPIQQIKISLNYRDWYPYAANLENETYLYLNLEYKY
jgi:hypothetical protein